MQDLEQAIRERAYSLWKENGCQDGHAEMHWITAQREVLASSLDGLGRVVQPEQTQSIAKPRKARAPRGKRAA